ncbi:hypothetical protein AB0E44_13875 [Micrococcus terreus]|uniref:aspartate racemase/maleate isomerase family protein n=1 Tax=Micrococcus terreus TaxID=574650 RepID=UPI0033FB1922
MTENLKIGLIVPPAGDDVPPEAHGLYEDSVEFIARGLGIPRMAPESFDTALERLEETVMDLVAQDVNAISLMGTSLSFYRGVSGNVELENRMRSSASHVPVTTLSSSILRALKSAEARAVSLVTAYDSDMTDRLVSFLESEGINVTRALRLDIVSIEEVHHLPAARLREAVEECMSTARNESDALLISCGGLRTLDYVTAGGDFPVISSSVDGIRDVVHLARQA